jgi:hypothetical protein
VHEDFYKDISTKFHVYNTWDYFNTLWHSLILLWIHEEKEEHVAFPWEVLSKNNIFMKYYKKMKCKCGKRKFYLICFLFTNKHYRLCT